METILQLRFPLLRCVKLVIKVNNMISYWWELVQRLFYQDGPASKMIVPSAMVGYILQRFTPKDLLPPSKVLYQTTQIMPVAGKQLFKNTSLGQISDPKHNKLYLLTSLVLYQMELQEKKTRVQCFPNCDVWIICIRISSCLLCTSQHITPHPSPELILGQARGHMHLDYFAIFYFMYVHVSLLCMYLPCVFLVPMETKRGDWIPLSSSYTCEPPHRHWGWNPL